MSCQLTSVSVVTALRLRPGLVVVARARAPPISTTGVFGFFSCSGLGLGSGFATFVAGRLQTGVGVVSTVDAYSIVRLTILHD